MSSAVFPALIGLGWSVQKIPAFNSRVQQAVSFMELRATFTPYPQWKWVLTYNVLRADATNLEYQQLGDFYLSRQGRYDSFLYDDPSDDSVTDMRFGTGDGSTTAFQLVRTFNTSGFAEPIYNLNGTPTIKDNGVVKTPGVDYTITNGLVTFTVAPTSGHALTWTGAYYWRVRFADDTSTFEEFMNQLWKNGSVAFVSVLGS